MPPPRKRRRKRIAEDEPPTKWTAPILGYPVTDADGNTVEVEGMPEFTDEQKRTFLENAEYFRKVRPKP